MCVCVADTQLRAGVRTKVVQTGSTREVSFVGPGQQPSADVSVASAARGTGRPVRAQSRGAHVNGIVLHYVRCARAISFLVFFFFY